MTAQLTYQGSQAAAMQPATPAGRGRLREAIHRIHQTVKEMNHASRRLVELQAPWSVDKQWHRK